MNNEKVKKGAVKLLKRASKLIGKGHWCRFMLTNGEGKYCAIGAMSKAAREAGGELSVLSNALAFKTLRSAAGGEVSTFNDCVARDARDVQRVMAKAVKLLDAGFQGTTPGI